MKNAMEPSQCRCCLSSLSQGLARDLYVTYVWLDHKEVYSDMLRECFNIVLSKGDSSSICEPCVSQVRAAAAFKQRVLQAERYFTIKLQSNASDENCAVSLAVKLEPVGSDDEDNYLLSDAATMTLEPVKKEEKEVKEVVQRRKRPLECKGGRSQKIRTLVKRLATSINSSEPPKSALNKNQPQMKRKLPKREHRNIKWISESKQDKFRHKENLETILKYSNAMPFKNKSLLGFHCAYCDTPFPDPNDLRSHTETKHKEECLSKSFDITEYNVKLDVSNLNCSICGEKIDNFTILKQHLVKVHGKTIHSDIKDHLLQFKLKQGDVYDCALCSNSYETFKMLKQHMNKHYANYSCGKCDNTFATRRSLNAHSATHQEGSFKCQYCDKVFSSAVRRQYHEKTSHTGSRMISNCPHCNEPFRSYYQRNQHLVKKHNTEAPYKCNVCSKGYLLKSILMLHIKKTHLMEKDVQCTECSYRFFSKKALRAHMVRHSGEKKYSCEVCHKCYARKYTLREHMRIHNNDRRFKCKVCAMTFVQKCSLKSHLLSNHGISMAACDITSS